ncbi:uncharacterized protein TRIADDRAFT_60280 [Trichoplax adhaerens]|uniref:IQ domain-containing protein E n=1 Tax=Trichoplax adhaerens TaxID=10228 RepID=B3S7S9_TRIAD|nr:hypothetical protein TRIADDRAFT_60280 [Trichoplax adhaerens]EDV21250.1 hypothetical protein TRIADDRAFT_60280 [Trichoplax adhaerens]|eukprot:XP_002116217.1 hypothetical protein TRIADDRAFT_60280 [Trichoplax adhaerens]
MNECFDPANYSPAPVPYDVLSATKQSSKKKNKAKKSTTGSSPYSNKSKSLNATKKGVKTSHERWVEAVRSRTAALTPQSSMGLAPGIKNPAQKSMSQYLQTLLKGGDPEVEIQKPKRNAKTRNSVNGFSYKPQEDMHDEIIEQKKIVANLRKEIDNQRAAIRKLELETNRKDKRIEQLIQTGEEERTRTFGDKKLEASSMVSTLKQRINSLEKANREKEKEISKLKDNIKNTQIKEIEIHMDSYYQEILRLQTLLKAKSDSIVPKKLITGHDEDKAKLKSLSETVSKLKETNEKLTEENETLTTEIDKLKSEVKTTTTAKKTSKSAKAQEEIDEDALEQLSKKEIIRKFSLLSKKLHVADDDLKMLGGMTIEDENSNDSKPTPLQGSLADRVRQLQAREIELLDDRKKLRAVVKKLKEDRTHYRNLSDTLQKKLDDGGSKGSLKSVGNRQQSESSERNKGNDTNEDDKATKRKEATSLAKQLSNIREQDAKLDPEEWCILIQSAIRGHMNRKQFLDDPNAYIRKSVPSDDEVTTYSTKSKFKLGRSSSTSSQDGGSFRKQSLFSSSRDQQERYKRSAKQDIDSDENAGSAWRSRSMDHDNRKTSRYANDKSDDEDDNDYSYRSRSSATSRGKRNSRVDQNSEDSESSDDAVQTSKGRNTSSSYKDQKKPKATWGSSRLSSDDDDRHHSSKQGKKGKKGAMKHSLSGRYDVSAWAVDGDDLYGNNNNNRYGHSKRNDRLSKGDELW